MRLQAVRATEKRLEAGEIVRDVVYIAIGLSCPMCDLELADTAEIRAAKIKQQYVKHEHGDKENELPEWVYREVRDHDHRYDCDGNIFVDGRWGGLVCTKCGR
jgi:hypothetical protein